MKGSLNCVPWCTLGYSNAGGSLGIQTLWHENKTNGLTKWEEMSWMRSEILIKLETISSEKCCKQSVTHNVTRRIYRNKCNPRTLDPLDTNSRRIIQIITPSIQFLANETTLRAWKPDLFVWTERVCHLNSNLKQFQSNRTRHRRGQHSSPNRFAVIRPFRRTRIFIGEGWL